MTGKKIMFFTLTEKNKKKIYFFLVNTKNISSHVLKISTISLMLRTREITDIFEHSMKYIWHSPQKVNILCELPSECEGGNIAKPKLYLMIDTFVYQL